MSDCVVELPQEVSVKASQRFEDPELARRSQAGDTEAFGDSNQVPRQDLHHGLWYGAR
jgi:hypothetical protein